MFLTVKQTAAKYPFFSESAIRWLVFRADHSFSLCLLRIGRKVLIDEDLWLKWIESYRR